jgi:glycogen operon protein
MTALRAGRPWPLGATPCTWHGEAGVNVAVFSAHAHALELCLYDERGERETARVALPGHSGDVWHGFLPGAGPGLVYGLRAHGRWHPQHGQRFNAHKLLLDPYAREIVGTFAWRDEHFDGAPGRPDPRDNGAHALKARVVAPHDGAPPPRPETPLADTVLYELHVRGFTMRHPGVPEALRGTYAGLASDAAIAHLQRLGVTAVSLLPVQQHLDEQRLAERGLSNYWGYNTVGYFAVEPRYASQPSRARDEFRATVARLHAAGIEVIVDVVYNHTAESDEAGPSISWRGLDNESWYRAVAGQPGRYENFSGCGNTLDLRSPRVLQMVLDSLRHWRSELHVDGFRFDLAPVLARGDHGFDAHAPFFHAVAQDPLLAGCKLIAEPWDVGPAGWRTGDFPRGWLEWNDRFRDGMRGYWLRSGTRGEFARRLAGSADLFHRRQRAPVESVNFITAHDGFTLCDALTYEHKRNEANGEHNRDGHAHEIASNGGVEGQTDDADVLERRARLQRALLASLLLSQGTPMLLAGDELGMSQRGNNNAYCQDNETTWLDWAQADAPLIDYTAKLIALRKRLLPLAAHWYHGRADAHGKVDLAWLKPDGERLHGDDWGATEQRALGAWIGAPGKADAPLLLLANPHGEDIAFTLPPGAWRVLIDSARDHSGTAPVHHQGRYALARRSVALLAETAS